MAQAKRIPDLAARRGYHHGNLREALLEGARQLVAERGPQGFTLSEAARRAGVSPSAPYRHFKDREEVLAELGRRGFALFAQRLQAAAGGARDAAEALRRMGPAYLAFAREEPGYYAAMFSFQPEEMAGEPEKGSPFEALTGTIGALLPGGAGLAGRNPRLVAMQVWALSHGVAMLERVGMPAPESGAPPAEAVLEKGVTALLGRM
ncbi:TetR/AcrR family transcriptional regulator [Dankookia sp. GCM10030260]|uniref:TetR/AcrR family transcriptional regulator n=1 Tax=Dankookia sp. GCM10030260 TaxID=3273390 RepID=UPI0036156FE9